jgi:hypothetical protein
MSAPTESIYQTGTLFRIYSADKSKHYTAVLLKNGKFLEVKGDEAGRVVYDSLEEFSNARSSTDSTLEITDKYTERKQKKEKALKEPISKSKIPKVIRCPKSKSTSMLWFRWCHSILKECAPDLLDREDVVKAYYTLAKVIKKYENEIKCHSTYRYKKSYRYAQEHVSVVNDWKNTPFEITPDPYINPWDKTPITPERQALKDKADAIRQEVLPTYKALVDLIYNVVSPYLKKIRAQNEIDDKIKTYTKYRDYTMRRLSRLQSEISHYTNIISDYNKKIDNLIEKREKL